MKNQVTLTITSLLSIVLFASHWADEVARGVETGGVSGLFGVLILVVWLYGTLVVGDRRSGYIIMLVASIGGFGVLVIHMMGAGLAGGRISIAGPSRIFFWVWILLVLGVTSTFSAILSTRGLWSLRQGQTR